MKASTTDNLTGIRELSPTQLQHQLGATMTPSFELFLSVIAGYIVTVRKVCISYYKDLRGNFHLGTNPKTLIGKT